MKELVQGFRSWGAKAQKLAVSSRLARGLPLTSAL